MKPDQASEKNPFLWWLYLAAALLFLVGSAPILAKVLLGVQYLPTTEWARDAKGFAWAVGMVLGLVGTLMVMRGMHLKGELELSFKVVSVVLFSPFFFGWLGYGSIIIGFPMIYAVPFGEPVEASFVVEKATGFSNRKCPNKIELQEMPLGFSELCGFSSEFRSGFQYGSYIVISGRGTPLGFFVGKARTVY